MLNPIFLKKLQGQKYPGRWEIVECKKPNVKMLFKINTNGHKHQSISLFIIEQDAIGETKENNAEIAHSQKTVLQTVMGCSFTNTERHSLRMYIYAL